MNYLLVVQVFVRTPGGSEFKWRQQDYSGGTVLAGMTTSSWPDRAFELGGAVEEGGDAKNVV